MAHVKASASDVPAAYAHDGDRQVEPFNKKNESDVRLTINKNNNGIQGLCRRIDSLVQTCC